MQNIKEYVATKKLVLKEKLKGNNLKSVIVQVGNVEASNRYVRNKIKDLEEVGITAELLKFSEDISEEALLAQIHRLNTDDTVTGYLVQLPLPKHISEEKVNLAIDPTKDIDGFHPLSKTIAATPLGVYNYLKDQNFEFAGKNAVIIGRSNIVGRPMHKLLLNANMNVVMLHTKTTEEDKRFYLEHADLIVVAVGKAKFLDGDLIKDGATVIDVGINRMEDGKLCGDVDFEKVKERASYITPVPGGVGPMTIAMLMNNVIKATKLQNDIKY